jgi:predicted Zn-dependent protease
MMDRMRLSLAGLALCAALGLKGIRAVNDEVLSGYLASLVAQFPLSASIEVAAFHTAVLPGGYVIVPMKLLQTVPDESALARTLARRLAHIARHHGMKQLSDGPVIYLAGC